MPRARAREWEGRGNGSVDCGREEEAVILGVQSDRVRTRVTRTKGMRASHIGEERMIGIGFTCFRCCLGHTHDERQQRVEVA
jgi:hypothetical protein